MGYLKKVYITLIVFIIILISGCTPYVENNTIEEIAPVTFWSINIGDEGKLVISTLIPPLIKEKKKLLTLEVDLLKQGGKNFNLKYYRELKSGQLRMLLINEELAKKGIISIINTLITDPEISQRIYLVIVRGNFDEYIENQLSDQENSDYFLYRMLRHYEKKNQGEITVINLHQFKNQLYSPFADPILPVFKAEKDNFTYEGTAIFSDDKLIETVTNMDDQVYQIIGNDHYLKFLTLPKLSVVIGHVRSDVDMNLNRKFTSLSVKVNMTGRIEEYRGEKNILNQKELMRMNRDIESYLEKQTIDLLKKMQEWRVDPFKIGTKTLSPLSKPLTDKEWLDKWSKMDINVDYQLELEPLSNVK
jgi:spore germination protein